jgi:uncharacterized repeat protein (TIGR02543 family)
MKKLISISASLLLAGASLVAIAAPAQAISDSATVVSVPTISGTGQAGTAVVATPAVITTTGAWSATPDVGQWRVSDTPVAAGSSATSDAAAQSIGSNLLTLYWASNLNTGPGASTVVEETGSPYSWGGGSAISLVGKYLFWVNFSSPVFNSQYHPNGGASYSAWSSSVRITAAPPTYNLTYNANSGAGMITATTGTGALTVSSGTNYTRSGYTLAGWNTLANGNGTPVALGASYTPSQNETLYAQWTAIPVTTPVVVQAPVYNGPEFNAIAGRVVDSVEGGKVVLTGRRLDSVTKISLAGKVLTPTKSTESSIELNVPAGTPGSATLEITFTSGRMTWTNAFDYVDPAVVKAQAANKLPKPAAKPATKPAAKVTKAKPKAKK